MALSITLDPSVFKELAVTLTVRLDSAIESALERHCAERGMTKSAVVQESLAAFLAGKATQIEAAADKRVAGPAFEAFRRAGLIGTGELGGASADKKAVRVRAMNRIQRSSKA
jgi:predicted transcriptional regulator